MEMVLESGLSCADDGSPSRFNPSSNGNGAGITPLSFISFIFLSFNPSSNGNGAGIKSFEIAQ